MTGVFRKERKKKKRSRHRDTDIEGRRPCEDGDQMLQPQAKNTHYCQEPSEAQTKEKFSSRHFRGSLALMTPDFRLLASRTVRE